MGAGERLPIRSELIPSFPLPPASLGCKSPSPPPHKTHTQHTPSTHAHTTPHTHTHNPHITCTTYNTHNTRAHIACSTQHKYSIQHVQPNPYAAHTHTQQQNTHSDTMYNTHAQTRYRTHNTHIYTATYHTRQYHTCAQTTYSNTTHTYTAIQHTCTDNTHSTWHTQHTQLTHTVAVTPQPLHPPCSFPSPCCSRASAIPLPANVQTCRAW